MNNLYVKQTVLAQFWASITMFAVVLSAFSAPFSVAFAETETTPDADVEEIVVEVVIEEPVTEEEVTAEVEVEAETEDVEVSDIDVEIESDESAPVSEQVLQTEDVPESDDVVKSEIEEEVSGEFAPMAMSFVSQKISVPTCQNLFENGSFENPEVTDASLWQKFASVTGWVIERVSDLSPTTLEVHRGWSNNEAANGSQYAELDGDHSAQISQTVSTVPGAEYELTWAFAPRHNIAADQNNLKVLVNGGVVGSNGPETGSAPLAADDWTYTTVSFVATTTDTTFTFRDMGPSNTFGTFIDDTQLCLIELPEEPEEVEFCSYEGSIISATADVDAKKNNGSPVVADRRNFSGVENGPAVYQNTSGKEPTWSTDDFFSLGIGGFLIYEFADYAVLFGDGSADPDFALYEITGGNSGQSDEVVEVLVSTDNVSYVSLGDFTGDAYIDVDGALLPYIKFIKLVDKSQGVQGASGDGYDLDAIVILDKNCGSVPVDEDLVEIEVCKYNAFEQPESGWSMTITNDQVDNKLVSYTVETGIDGCVSQAVNPQEGPFYVIEENKAGWEQVDVWVEGGLVEEGQGAEICSFFKLTDQEPAFSAQISEVVKPVFTCNFMNEESSTPAPVCKAGVNLVQNGSFETPNIPEDGFGWDIYDSVANGLAWVVNWLNPTEASPVPAKLELQSGYYAASNGVQYAELDSNWNAAPGGPYNGEDTRVSIYQDIATIPGNTYTVSYDFSALPRRGADTNILQVLLDDSEVAEHSADGIGQTDTVWNSYSYSFVATTTETRVGFADAGLADSFGTLLDNVSVVCEPTIPEEEEEDSTPGTSGGGGGGYGGPALQRAGTPTVAGDSISAPTPEPMVLGEQVTAVPYGAPGTGHGGSAQQSTLSLGNLLFLAVRRTDVK